MGGHIGRHQQATVLHRAMTEVQYMHSVLLDNQSIVDVFCNGELLVDIHTIAKSITICTNGGKTVVNMVERFLGYGWVWYDPDGIANIITLTTWKRGLTTPS